MLCAYAWNSHPLHTLAVFPQGIVFVPLPISTNLNQGNETSNTSVTAEDIAVYMERMYDGECKCSCVCQAAAQCAISIRH